MPLNYEEIISVVQQVTELRGMRAAASGIVKGTCTVGACAAAGGVIGGPFGLGIGGIVGSVLAMVQGQGKYKSVPEIIMYEMTTAQKRQLARSLENIFVNLDATDITMAVTLLMANNSLQGLLVTQLGTFLQNEMGVRILN